MFTVRIHAKSEYLPAPASNNPSPSSSASSYLLPSDPLEACSSRSYQLDFEDAYVFGRSSKLCNFVINHPLVSNEHLRIYTVQFETGHDDSTVQPLVYAEDLSRNGCFWQNVFMGSGSNAFLLSDGDVIKLCHNVSLTVYLDEGSIAQPVHLEAGSVKIFEDQYELSNRVLGAGGQASVFMAIKKQTSRQVACKIRSLVNDEQEPMDSIEKAKLVDEARILLSCNHPNIIQLENYYVTEWAIFIFEELIPGGDLFSHLIRHGGRLSEPEAAVITRQLLDAVSYLHENGIVHRDLKLDNILICSRSPNPRIVLTDFGCAAQFADAQGRQLRRLETHVGTREYVAPEVYDEDRLMDKGGYTTAVDMWSIGCIIANMLSGTHLLREFTGWQNTSQIKHMALAFSALDTDKMWKKIGRLSKDLLRKLIVLDETKRLTAHEAKSHKWFTHKKIKAELDNACAKALRGVVAPASRRTVSPTNYHVKMGCASKSKSKVTRTKSKPVPPAPHLGSQIINAAFILPDSVQPAIQDDMEVDPNIDPKPLERFKSYNVISSLDFLEQNFEHDAANLHGINTLVDMANTQMDFEFDYDTVMRSPHLGAAIPDDRDSGYDLETRDSSSLFVSARSLARTQGV